MHHRKIFQKPGIWKHFFISLIVAITINVIVYQYINQHILSGAANLSRLDERVESLEVTQEGIIDRMDRITQNEQEMQRIRLRISEIDNQIDKLYIMQGGGTVSVHFGP